MERLRLAHDGSSSPTLSSRPHVRRRSTFTARTRHLLENLDTLPALPSFNPTSTPTLRRHGHKARRPDTPVNPDTAAWFANLPPAIRRKHFTKEEQILYANECQAVILDAADELLQKQTAPLETPSPSLVRPHTSYSDALTDQYFSLDDDFYSEYNSESEHLEQDEDLTEKMDDRQIQDSLSWLDDTAELDLHLDDYHAAIAETAQRQAATPSRQSFRRNLSLSTMSLRRSSISSPSKSISRGQTQSVYFRPIETPTSPHRPFGHHASRSSISSMDPRATHYQDPAARMKLRVYLANASKFDEAIEFGFPSTVDKQHNKWVERPKTSPRLTNESGRTFFTDETPSLAGDDASSQGDVPPDPRTPDDSEFRDFLRSQKNSGDRLSVKPQILRSEQYAQSTTLDREMTIHMTLTRPDLRSPTETRPASRHINAQPLEQTPLPPLDNPGAFWDTLPSHESKVKKLWRKMRRVQ